MSLPDLNLLVTLDVLLSEGNVTRAAKRLRLSPSAMSRALARLRETTGDPLLVRAGRGLVPTPRALELRTRVSQLVQDAQSVLRPAEIPDLQSLQRTFTLRTSEGFAENFGPELIARTMGPELRAQSLFRDRFVGVVRMGHALSEGELSPLRYAAGQHIGIARQGLEMGPIDEAMSALGLERKIATIVGGFSTAVAMARASDLIASVPERHTGNLRFGSLIAPLNVPLPAPAQCESTALFTVLGTTTNSVTPCASREAPNCQA